MGLPLSADNISHKQVVAVLAHLNFLLANLPKQLPTVDGLDSQYGTFLSFALDPEILEKTGDEVATLGEQLESIFGWKACTSGDGIIPIPSSPKIMMKKKRSCLVMNPIVRVRIANLIGMKFCHLRPLHLR